MARLWPARRIAARAASPAGRGPRLWRTARIALPLLVLACATPAPRTSEPPTPPLRADRFLDPRLACEPDGALYLAAIEKTDRGQRLFLAASGDHGESWRTLAPLADAQPGSRRRPQLAMGAPGEVYVLWEDTRAGSPGIWFNGTRDGGRTWLPSDRRVDAGGASAHPTSPALACDDRGTLYVAWLDARDGFDALYVNTSRDHGISWEGSDRRVGSLSLGRRARLRLACDLQGTLYAVWVEERGGTRRVYGNASNDRGATWQFDDAPLSAGFGAAGVEIVCTDSRTAYSRTAVAVWLEEEPAAVRIEAALTEDQGRSWQTASLAGRTSPPLANYSLPRIVSGSAREIYVAWHALASDGTSRLVVQASPDAGRTALETVLARPQPLGPAAFAPERRWIAAPFALAADRTGNVYLAWVEGMVGAPTIGFDRIASHGRVWSRVPTGPESFGHDPLNAGAPEVATDDFGHICVLWNEGSRLHIATSPFYGEAGWRHTDL